MNKFLRENKVSKMTAEQRNAWYKALTAPQKAVAICEDVLLQIKNQKYIMEKGVYFRMEIADTVKQRTVFDILSKPNLEEAVAAKSVTCSVCAIGSAFMSAVRLGNNCSTKAALEIDDVREKDYYGDGYEYEPGSEFSIGTDKMEDKLQEAFTSREYRAMEFMFEDCNSAYAFTGNDISILNQETDKYDHLQAEEKMIKMCKQIIKAGGYFFVEGVDLENINK